ncbi:MAG: intein-containing RctB family protein [Candidatus Omnitrophota bacterium]
MGGKIWQGTLEKIDDYRWRIPKTYKQGMRVPGIIYANDKLLKDIRNDQALEQVANVAFLPGILKASLAMPDSHWGYGFCIGGVAATDIEESGVISPGGVGYDINCLSPDTKIKMQHGYYLTIADLEDKWDHLNTECIDFREAKEKTVNIERFIKIKPRNKVYKIITEAGDEIISTEDHPFWTPDGMLKVRYLSKGSKIAISPFMGSKYEKPSSEIVLNESSIKNLSIKLNKDHIIKELKKRKLLPLSADSPKLPFILKLMGYHMGDGTMYITKGKGTVWFYGQPRELELIREDILSIGYTPSRIYERERRHRIITSYDTYEFTQKEYSIKVVSRSFLSLLFALGVPMGKKAYQDYAVPQWIFGLKRWQKRLFLAGLFDAELSSPKSLYNYNFYAPCLSMNKIESFIDNGIDFIKSIVSLLGEFGIKTQKIGRRKEYRNKEGYISYRLRLVISSDLDNMVNFYSLLGFEYNLRKKNTANLVLQYLKLKKKVIQERMTTEEVAIQLYKEGIKPQEIYEKLSSRWINKRFLERSIFEGRETSSRVAFNFPHFMEYKKEATEGIKDSCYLWEKIASLKEVEYEDFVYDLTVNHPSHNFIANNFVVSNCGVRLVRTNLSFDEVKTKLENLTTLLFQDVPAGVGSKGEIRVSKREEKQILIKGARWAIEKGFGSEEDLAHTEENGEMQGADPSFVSDRAFERGKAQSGTLGSGNHFMEIQMIEEIYDETVASRLNLFKGQISLMIHSGSRGFGYQVCDDYIKNLMPALNKYNIQIPDRQLVCAPVNSAEGKSYLAAMRCAANYAWANRQCLMYLARKVFEKVFNKSYSALGMNLIYDVAHNIAKVEKHKVEGREKTLCVHRKGATRAFGPGHPALPSDYKDIGQPVIIPGDMGRNSYLLVGTQKAMEETFGSTCHGAGRLKSRHEAMKNYNASELVKELRNKGIIVMASTRGTITEEAPGAYKDVNDVVDVVDKVGIAKKVCRMRPLGVIKG